jgi:hypothetical protein
MRVTSLMGLRHQVDLLLVTRLCALLRPRGKVLYGKQAS